MDKAATLLGGIGLLGPMPLSDSHDCSKFRCREQSSTAWLKKRAVRNDLRGFSRVYVVCDSQQVVAYYALSPTFVPLDELPDGEEWDAPNQVGGVLLGQLAVDKRYEQKQIGSILLIDAFKKAVAGSSTMGGSLVVVQPLTEKNRLYYLKRGFQDLNGNDQKQMFITMDDVRATMAAYMAS